MTHGADPTRGVYGISVASDLLGIGAQSLRAYERVGLLTPARTDGGTRRYSDDDLDRVRRIAELLDAGLNLAGIALVLDLQDDNAVLQDRNAALRADLDEANAEVRRSRRGRQPKSHRG
jgi:MerR family transcriptional regulator, heat shock protein HspR